ncbi:alpha/beta fold hydrolase [Candidatus Thioglobus sp.]|nr:alpha/beta fold hydrolase [Candidatus Thioglobus sp.]MDA8981460.1 alpha/beta fold hydrolase [Candidatus Thioglobus sp.]
MLWHKTIGDGPSLVLLHGWAFNSDIFQSLIDKYKANYRITVIDLPGHGRSGDIDGNIESWCNELAKIIPEQSILLGWSLGGLLSTYIASQIEINKLILVAATPCLVNNDNWNYGISTEVFDQFAINLKNDSTKSLKRFVNLQSKDKSQLHELYKSIQKYPASHSALNTGLEIIINSDLRDIYKDIAVPKTTILGSLDTLVPVKIKEWYEAVGSQTSIIRSGHLPFIDKDFKL